MVAWIIDAQNFVLRYFDAIQESALHLYHSALPFCPHKSFLRQHHQNLLKREVQVKIRRDEDWKVNFRTIKTKSSKLSSIIFTQDGSLIATSGDHSIQIFQAATGVCLATMVLPSLRPQAIAFSGDNIYLLSSWSDIGVRLWDVQTGNLVGNCVGEHQSNVIDVAFSAKSSRFSSLDDHGKICVRSTESGKLECTLKVERGTTYCLWSSEDNILIIYAPTIVHCFNVLVQLSVQSFQEHQNSPSILTINHMGPLVVWMEKNVVVAHNLLTHKKVNLLKCHETSQSIQEAGKKNLQKYGKSVLKYIVLSLDAKFLILRKSELKVYELLTGSPKPQAILPWVDQENDVVFAPDGGYFAIASAKNGMVHFYRCNSNVLRPKKSKYHAAITHVCTSPNGKLIISGHQDGNVNIWSQKFGYMSFTKEVRSGRSVEALALSPDQRYLAIHFRKSDAQKIAIEVWNVEQQSEGIQKLVIHQTKYLDPTSCALKFLDSNNLMHMAVSERRTLDFHFWASKSGKFETYKETWIQLYDTIERPWILEADNKAVVLYHSGNAEGGYSFNFEWKHTFSDPRPNRYHLKVKDNWILDRQNRRIIWLPYDVLPSDGNWDEKGNWASQYGRGADILVLGERTGRFLMLDFSAVKDVIPPSFAGDVTHKWIKIVFQKTG